MSTKKTVLITGASRGLGKALFQTFPSEYRFILNARNTEKSIPNIHQDEIIDGDLRNESVLKKLREVAERLDIDILIHNAAVYHKGDFSGLSELDFLGSLELNFIAPIRLTHALWPIFERKRSGLIVFINSIAGKQGSDGETAYCASKHGLAGFARSLQFDAMRIGVQILSVFLGGMKTDMTQHREDWDKLMDPQEVAAAIVSLCEDYETLGIREVDIGRTIY